MLMLWDRHPEMPYSSAVPWPKIDYGGHQDYHAAVEIVDQWLRSYIGRRWVEWTWGLGCFNQNIESGLCFVSFKQARSVTLFHLRFQ